jgi:hypothetical protein
LEADNAYEGDISPQAAFVSISHLRAGADPLVLQYQTKLW